MLSLQAVMSS